MIVARFIHRRLSQTDLPVTWTYPEAGVYQGAQVIGVEEALSAAMTGDHADDFFNSASYGWLAILEVTGMSGQRGPLTYSAVTAEDVSSMHIIELTDARFGWAMMCIAMDLADDGYAIDFDGQGMPVDGWYEDFTDEVVALLLDEMTQVTPTWVDTLNMERR